MKLFCLTGGISTGKSTCLAELRAHSSTAASEQDRQELTVIDSDLITHELQRKANPNGCFQEIVDVFGNDVVSTIKKESENEKEEEVIIIDRVKLGAIIFGNSSEAITKRRRLEKIMVPRIQKKILSEVWRLYWTVCSEHIVIVDAPTYYEMKRAAGPLIGFLISLPFSAVIVTTSSPQKQLERLIKRNDLTEEEAKKRISSQISLKEKEELGDVIIRNDGTKEDLLREIDVAVKILDCMDCSFNGINRFFFLVFLVIVLIVSGAGFFAWRFLVSHSFKVTLSSLANSALKAVMFWRK